MSERSTFSPFWHRVRVMRPRLRPHVQITRQHYRGQRWHVVHDPSSNGFFRLNAVAHEFVGLLDGRRGVEEVWQLGLARHGDAALTQNEVIQLLSQLFTSNLLTADVPPETEQLLGRGRDRLGRKVKQQAIGLMYFKIRLFNPDRLLTWLEPLFRPLIGRAGFLLWAALVIAAVSSLLPHWDRLARGVDSAIAPSNWGWMIAVFVASKLWHELGHGIVCKRFGGQVPEFGAMMLVLLPAPYVDASAAWGFPSKWRRIAVGAGGMIFELALASGAAFVWLGSAEGSLPHQLAYNAMFTAGVSTVLFNANPLMKFDGYYILSDLLEVPNLMQRSFGMLKFIAQRRLYGVKDATPPTASASEASILVAYGLAAMVYRVFLFVSITLYVMGKMFAIGLFLAAWTAATWFILPVGGFVHWLATGVPIAERRGRAIATSLALVALGAIAIGAVPAPDRRRAVGVVESADRTGLFFGADGFVTAAHARPGDRVRRGDPVVTCESDQLLSLRRLSLAQLEEALSREAEATAKNPGAAQVAGEYVRTMREQIALVEGKIGALTVRAPHDGVIVGDDPAALVGVFVREGQPLAEVIDDAALRVAATLTQTEASWLYELNRSAYRVEMRLVSGIDAIVPATTERVLEAGRRELPHPSLGFAGGGTVETDSEDRTGLVAKRPLFKAYFVAQQGEAPLAGLPGERVHLRFALPDRPLLGQWIDRVGKMLQGRAKL